MTTTELPVDTATLFEWLDRRQRNKDFTGVVSLLTKVSEESRVAVAPLAETHIKSIKGDAWWRPALPPQAAGLGLIVIGTAPTAAKAAALLTRREMRDGVPRTAGAEVLTRASALTGAAGRAFAEMLRSGGVADPIATRIEQRTSKDRPSYEMPRRVVVRLEPSAPTGLRFERRLLHLTREAYPAYAPARITDVWPMTMPHHRDVVAAWGLPGLAALADMDDKGSAQILPLLAECDGPIGLGLSYGLAYAFGARHESDRIAAVDAFLVLAARGEPFAAGVGAALGDLAADGAVKLSRVVAALGDIHRAGASGAIWELLAVALPLLLPIGPRALPDLLELAAQVAPAAGAKGTFAELDAVAGRSGSSRLVREAKRLHSVLNQ